MSEKFKVFISWSGPLSRDVSELLRNWIPLVIQGTDVWISTEDIDKGSIWFTKILDNLTNTQAGIICLTKDNLRSPWIHFEAGGMVKGLSKENVCTLLIDLTHDEVRAPLSNFNGTKLYKDDMRFLIRSLNKSRENKLESSQMDKIFEKMWGDFEEDLKKVLVSYNVSEAHYGKFHKRRNDSADVQFDSPPESTPAVGSKWTPTSGSSHHSSKHSKKGSSTSAKDRSQLFFPDNGKASFRPK